MKAVQGIITAGLLLAGLAGLAGCKESNSTQNFPQLEQMVGQEMVTRLPAQGTLYVVNDFHANFSDYQAFKDKTKIFERIKNGEDLYLVINGDIIDSKESSASNNGDTKILQDLIREKAELQKRGKDGRIMVLRGNHEEQVLKIYEEMRKYQAQGMSREEFIRGLYGGRNGSFYQQFNFIERITEELYEFLKREGLVVQSANGIIIAHGSCPKINSPEPVQEILWRREGDCDDFLKAVGAELMVNGHSFPSWMKRQGGVYDPKRRIAIIDEDRVVIAPSHDDNDGGTFLRLDLSKVYRTARDLKLGEEVVLLR